MNDLEMDLRDLSKERFESLIYQLLVAKYPSAGITRSREAAGTRASIAFKAYLAAVQRSGNPSIFETG